MKVQEAGGGGVVHVLVVVVQPDHVGPGQEEVLVWMMVPVCPVGQESVWVCGALGVQVRGGVLGHAANSQFGPVRPTAVPSEQSLASCVQAGRLVLFCIEQEAY